MPADPRVDAFITHQADFAQSILTWLRDRVHAACPDATETIKWGMPFFEYRGRPLANMAAFKAHASFGFWDRGALATGQEGGAMGQYGRIASLADLPPAEALEAQVRAAMTLIEGERPKRAARPPKPPIETPPALIEALARDRQAAATYDGFTPGCRREYDEWIAQAKRPDTRDKRVAQAIEWLREGKRRHWKYERC